MPRLLIRGGRVIDPASGRDGEVDVLLEGGKIRKIGSCRQLGADEEIDAKGLIVAPGLIDIHVHLREPGKGEETIRSGATAAVHGGVTSVAAMPNTDPAVDSEAAAEFVILQGARAGMANVYPIGAVTKGRKGEELAELGRLARAGAVAFTDDGAPVASAELMRRGLEYAAMFDRPVIEHCQDPDLSRGGVMHEGEVSVQLGLPGIPAAAEEVMAERDIALAAMTGGHLHVAHISTAGTVDAVRAAKKRGLRVTTEVCPHHLVLTDEACRSYDPNTKMYPPLRSAQDIAAMIEGIRDGTIDAIASDHAPHAAETKDVEFAEAPFGIVGLETLLAISAGRLVHEGVLDWPAFLALLTCRPADVLRLPKGRLAEGADADVVLIDPDREWTVDAAAFKSLSRNTPFHGWNVRAKAVCTIVGGEIKYREVA